MKKINVKIIIIITGALLALAGLLVFHSSYLGWNGYNGYRTWPCAMGYGSIGGIMMLLWIVVIGALIYMIFKAGSDGKFSLAKTDALEVLKQRYAKGEISKAAFESMKRTLQ
jgi:putative membrane protein